MTKLVLGIIAIGLLQLAFVAYTHLQEPLTVAMLPEQPAASADAVPTVVPDLPPVARGRVVPLEYDDAEPSARARSDEQRFVAAPSRSDATIARSSIPSIDRSSGATEFMPAKQARPDDFSTVVISYTGRQTESASCDPPTTERPKSRSLLAKAAPVVKKPWEFLKAVGSKLD